MANSKFSNEDLSRWKREINPAPIIGTRVKLHRENAEFVGTCPPCYHDVIVGHPDKSPSFKVYKLDGGVWGFKCFGCGANGNVFQFVQAFDNVSFVDAVKCVLVEAGEQGWADGASQGDVSMPEGSEPKACVTFTMSEYYPAIRALEESDSAQRWLAARGISMPVARQFCLGFVQSAEKVTSNNAWMNDGWITFPTLTADRKTVTAVKYRSLVAKKGVVDGKKNSGILRAPNTSTTLYNMQSVDTKQDVWVVEGEPDAIVLGQAGLVAVAYSGAAYTPTDEECDQLSIPPRRFLAGDNDGTGMKTMAALEKRLRGATHAIKWPNNRKDANDVLTNECGNDPEKFRLLIEDLRSRATRTDVSTIEFHSPARPDSDGEYVINPAEGQEDGWFPLGDISLIGGASGTGKTTFVFEMLHKQKNGWPVLDHRTFKRSFHVLAYDRGKNAFIRTLRRLKLLQTDIPTTSLPLAFGAGAVQNIINQIESMNPVPEVIFIEGLDMLLDDTNKKSVVAPFMRQLQEVAAHFHIALIGSLGAPKTKRGEDYAAKRDHLSGSEAWGRNCETVAILEFTDDDDGTAPQRSLTVLPRNAKAEKFTLQFENGRLVPFQPTEDPEKAPNSGRPNEAIRVAIAFLEKRLQGGPQPSKGLLRDAHELHNISRPTLYRAADEMGVVKGDPAGGSACWYLPRMNAVAAPETGNGGPATADIDFGGK